MNTQNISNDLIDYVVALLKLFENNLPENENFSCENMSRIFSVMDSPNAVAAQGIIKFMNAMPGGFLIYQADGNEDIIYANNALLRIFECETMNEFRRLTGGSFKGIVYHEDLEDVEESIREQIKNSQFDLDYVEYRIVTKNGEIRWVEDYGHFIHSKFSGDIFYVFIGDATDKRAARLKEREEILKEKRNSEQQLKDIVKKYDKEKSLISQEYLRRLEVIKALSVNYESILYVDLDNDYILPYRLSKRTKKQFSDNDHAREFLWFVSYYIQTWVHPEDRDIIEQATTPEYIREKLATTKSYFVNYRVIKDDNTNYLQLRIVNVGNSRHISQIVMGYRRIDEEVLHEMEQKKLLEDALQSANLAIVAKNTFLSNMSHDMRTPLNAIFGFTTLAKEHIDDTKLLSEYLDKIDVSARLLLNSIEEVLEITWTESNDANISETECNLQMLVQNIFKSFLPSAEEKRINFTTDLSGLSHHDVYSDQDKLSQLLGNLVNNAIKYTNNGGNVELIVSETNEFYDNYATYNFVVKDNGIGISSDFIDNIFNPFEREKNTTLSGIHGSGLGLTIARNIAEMMGGTISVDSTVGEGSTFTLTLNMRIQNNPVQTDDDTKDVLMKLLNQKILLVEDNEINLEIETELLKGLGIVIESATNGQAAVDRIALSAPGEFALILMDIQMPVMDGWQASKAIRKLDNPELAGIPIIALSANAFESDKRTSLECGMDAHLTKPIDIPALLEVMAKVLRKY